MDDNPKSQSTVLRIGIVGAANIARKNVKAIQHPHNLHHCKLVAIASRSKERGTRFLSRHVAHNEDIKLYAGDDAYAQIINDVDIDALYMPLPTKLHLEYVKQAISAGKHVLVEKPVATSHAEYEEMSNLAKEKKKFLMDGTMFVHNPRTKQVTDFLSSNKANLVTRIQSDFTFLGDDDFFTNNIRIRKDGDILGCIGDLGWYCIRMAQLAFKAPAKYAQVVHYELNADGVPIDATCLVSFENLDQASRSKTLSFHCSFLHPLTQDVTFYGSDQTLYIDDFVIPREEGEGKKNSFEIKSQTLSHADLYSEHENQVIESTLLDDGTVSTSFNPPQEALMWNNFTKFCKSYDENDEIRKKEANRLLDISLESQRIVDGLMKSIRQNGAQVIIDSA